MTLMKMAFFCRNKSCYWLLCTHLTGHLDFLLSGENIIFLAINVQVLGDFHAQWYYRVEYMGHGSGLADSDPGDNAQQLTLVDGK